MDAEERTDWEDLTEFARNRPIIEPHILRNILGTALRDQGYQALVSPGDGEHPVKDPDAIPTFLTATVFWSFGVSAVALLGLSWWWTPAAILAAFLVATLLFTLSSRLVSFAIPVGWVVLGIYEVVTSEPLVWGLAYALPLALRIAYSLAKRTFRIRQAQDYALAIGGVVKSAPLVAPLVLAILFLPALSADVWQVAQGLSASSILAVGVVSVLLIFLVVRLSLGQNVESTIESRARFLCDLPARSDLTRTGLLKVARDEDKGAVAEFMDSTLAEAWPVGGEEYAPYIHEASKETLKKTLTPRLALTVIAVGVLFAGYIYILYGLVVSTGLAHEWTGAEIPTTTVEVLGFSVNLQGGPYLKLSALMGLVATATFLSFALIEDRFAKAVTGALLQEPADRLLIVALPYVKLWEDATELGRLERMPPDVGDKGSGESTREEADS